jgi:hypothetical protein
MKWGNGVSREMMMKRLCLLLTFTICLSAQIDGDFTRIRVEVDFDQILREWDGFGFNYVEVSQTVNYDRDPQEYGGFSLLTERERQEIVDLIFGDDGLRPGLLKMFCDPWHQESPDGPFNHEKTTGWMRYFVREGLNRARSRGDSITILTTLYGPPAWATRQKFLRGRDLDPSESVHLAEYMIHWVKWLRQNEKFPVKYVSLHNEGEDWMRWPADGKSGNIGHGHDYNLYWPPEQVVDYIRIMRSMLDASGLADVGVTPGECTNWYRFSAWGYADAIACDPAALECLGLITSHGFYSGNYGRWFGEHRSVGTDVLRSERPQLHAWVTSTSWSQMDANSLKEHHGNIYSAKVNGIIPWAGIQRPAKWVGGDPNPGCAITVSETGEYSVQRGYYYYKQVCRAGQPGMGVSWTMAIDSELAVIGFAKNGTTHPDAFILVNIGKADKKTGIRIKGGSSSLYQAYRTTDDLDRYTLIGDFRLENDMLYYTAPARSATTFYAN